MWKETADHYRNYDGKLKLVGLCPRALSRLKANPEFNTLYQPSFANPGQWEK